MIRAWIIATFGIWDVLGPLVIYLGLDAIILIWALKRRLRPPGVALRVLPPTIVFVLYSGWLYHVPLHIVLLQVAGIGLGALALGRAMNALVPDPWGVDEVSRTDSP